MADDEQGPDLTAGVAADAIPAGGMLRGRVGDEAVLLTRVDGEVVAIGAECTHAGGPLDQGLIVDGVVHCPWHHACFSLRTGEALAAPAFDPVTAWTVERDGERVVVRERAAEADPGAGIAAEEPASVVIVGGGAAGFACAEMLRRHGYAGRVTLLSADADAPYDRPSLSKAFLAGDMEADALPLRGEGCYADSGIDLHLGTEVTAIDVDAQTVTASDGTAHPYDRLVLATGAEPVHPPILGADGAHVFTLRTARDAEAIIARVGAARTAVLVGSGFIGMEAAASLTQRGVQVHVVTEDAHPMEQVIGRPLSDRLRAEHESHGTVFHTETSATRIEPDAVILQDGTRLDADLVVLGVGVQPRVALAEDAGLDVDDGVLVDECLRTSAPGVYAAGDSARWRDAREDRTLRIEHWVVAERHGQHVARSILFGDRPFTDVPYFWTKHHSIQVRYVGHADGWDEMDVDGDVDALDCVIRFRTDGRTDAIAAVGRDLDALQWEAQREAEAPTA